MAKDEKKLTVDVTQQNPASDAEKVNPFAQAKQANNPHEVARAASEEPEVFEGNEVRPGIFQSEAAERAFRESLHAPVPDEPVLARVTQPALPRAQITVDFQAQQEKMVKIKPLQTINRFRVGRDWYQVKAGQPTLVPRHVATLLAQKGIVP